MQMNEFKKRHDEAEKEFEQNFLSSGRWIKVLCCFVMISVLILSLFGYVEYNLWLRLAGS